MKKYEVGQIVKHRISGSLKILEIDDHPLGDTYLKVEFLDSPALPAVVTWIKERGLDSPAPLQRYADVLFEGDV